MFLPHNGKYKTEHNINHLETIKITWIFVMPLPLQTLM
jgi:hypothetical protein